MPVNIGDIAPEVTLYDTEKQLVSLSALRGNKVVIVFFPLAFSSVCTAELCNMRDNISAYNNLNAEIIGISVDSLYTLAKFKSDQQLNFTLLSDFNKEVSTEYSALYDVFPSFNMRGVSKRAAFVLDTNGIVQYVEVCEKPQHLPDFSAIMQKLQSID